MVVLIHLHTHKDKYTNMQMHTHTVTPVLEVKWWENRAYGKNARWAWVSVMHCQGLLTYTGNVRSLCNVLTVSCRIVAKAARAHAHWSAIISASKEATACGPGNCQGKIIRALCRAARSSLWAQMSTRAWVWFKQIQPGMRHWQEAVVPISDICTAWPGGWRVCSGLKNDMCNVTTHLSCFFGAL